MAKTSEALGSPLRTIALVGTVFFLTAATFAPDTPIPAVAFYVRYPFAVVLLLLTLHQGASASRALRQAPKAAAALVRWAWGLVLVSALLAPFSIAPAGAVAQLAIFAVLVATMHVHITHRWHYFGTTTTDLRTIFWTLSVPVVISALTGRLRGARLAGLFENPNTFAIMALLAVAVGLGVWSQHRTVATTVVLAINIVGMVMTQSRTALLAFAIAATVLVVRKWSGRIHPTVILAIVSAGVVVLLTALLQVRIPVPQVIGRFMTGADDPLNTRDLAWSHALDLWSDHPLTGVGFRVGDVAFKQASHLTAFGGSQAHNSYIQVLLEVGVLGFVPFAAMLLTLIRTVSKVEPTGIGIGYIAVVIVGLMAALTESYLFGIGQAACWVFWLIAAAAASATGSSAERRDAGVRRQITRP